MSEIDDPNKLFDDAKNRRDDEGRIQAVKDMRKRVAAKKTEAFLKNPSAVDSILKVLMILNALPFVSSGADSAVVAKPYAEKALVEYMEQNDIEFESDSRLTEMELSFFTTTVIDYCRRKLQ